jgi:hypothetical protein
LVRRLAIKPQHRPYTPIAILRRGHLNNLT